MNFSEENKKPLYLIRPPRLSSYSARQKFESLANEQLVEDAGGGFRMIKAAAINSMPELLEEAVTVSDPDAIKKLVIARLKAVPEKHYRFLDGTDFTGAEAARAVEEGTARGNYFLRLEEQVLKLARAAKQRGEF